MNWGTFSWTYPALKYAYKNFPEYSGDHDDEIALRRAVMDWQKNGEDGIPIEYFDTYRYFSYSDYQVDDYGFIFAGTWVNLFDDPWVKAWLPIRWFDNMVVSGRW